MDFPAHLFCQGVDLLHMYIMYVHTYSLHVQQLTPNTCTEWMAVNKAAFVLGGESASKLINMEKRMGILKHVSFLMCNYTYIICEYLFTKKYKQAYLTYILDTTAVQSL